LAAFATRIGAAGAVNSLTQTLLRLTSPGVPDLYQGTEFWDFSLVDPDNRRPVDFEARRAALDSNAPITELLERWQDGAVKQAVVASGLAFRARAPGLFTVGAYTPIRVEGALEDHILAFVRVHEGRAAVVAGVRLPAALQMEAGGPMLSQSQFDGTTLVMPRNLVNRRFINVITGASGDAGGEGVIGARMPAASILTPAPVALLEVR
jgi:(1->4)-alpha-D-glucan 1-alpha-D-glucosylmutase